MDFSVCMSVYYNDRPQYVNEAIKSLIIEQTLLPTEVILVIDGEISKELSEVISFYKEKYSNIFNVIELNKNQGLGKVLNIAIKYAKYNIIARMDSDDIALPNRFEKQIKCFEKDPSLSIVGGTITEFIDTPNNIVGKRICPSDDSSIKHYMKSRCGFNHMTVMFKKEDVLKAGNYQDWHYNEDYYLWIRMMLTGCKFANLPDTLVNVRVGKEMYQRRGGWKYFKSEESIQRYMWKHGLISFPHYCFNTAVRFGIQVVIPNKVRGWVFQKLFRK